jgi:hypothetical protein
MFPKTNQISRIYTTKKIKITKNSKFFFPKKDKIVKLELVGVQFLELFGAI